MTQLVLAFVLISAAALAAGAASVCFLFRARAASHIAVARAAAIQKECRAALKLLREELDAVTAQLRELQQQPPLMVAPSAPRPGFNLTSRSQALRMHRRGDAPDQIAAALELPLQEVDLLLKVHRIVLSNI
ncbi:MAG: DUF2802 domain-containing protein [Acidobacteriia bacterium]|nr:DUF2802 domain-containing protein [Terriglobia bacterium]